MSVKRVVQNALHVKVQLQIVLRVVLENCYINLTATLSVQH